MALLSTVPACNGIATTPEEAVCDGTTCSTGKLLRGCPECVYAREVDFDLDACKGDLPIEEIERSLAIDARFAETFEAFDTQAGRTVSLLPKVLDPIGDLFKNPDQNAAPPGFTYDADGNYVETGGPLIARFYFGKDYAAGKLGDPIVPSLFLLDSYLSGADVTTLSEGGTKVTVKFTAPGSLVELLDEGPNPTSPLVFHWLFGDLLRQQIGWSIHVSAPPSAGASAEYDIALAPTSIFAEQFWFPGVLAIPSSVSGAKLQGADPSQTATISAWKIDVEIAEIQPTPPTISSTPPLHSALRGRAELSVKGGQLSHRTVLLFDGLPGSKPAVHVECL